MIMHNVVMHLDTKLLGLEAKSFWSSYCKMERIYTDHEIQPQDRYSHHKYGIECRFVTKHYPFNIGNIIKYIWRLGHKDDVITELKKIRDYIWFEREYLFEDDDIWVIKSELPFDDFGCIAKGFREEGAFFKADALDLCLRQTNRTGSVYRKKTKEQVMKEDLLIELNQLEDLVVNEIDILSPKTKST